VLPQRLGAPPDAASHPGDGLDASPNDDEPRNVYALAQHQMAAFTWDNRRANKE